MIFQFAILLCQRVDIETLERGVVGVTIPNWPYFRRFIAPPQKIGQQKNVVKWKQYVRNVHLFGSYIEITNIVSRDTLRDTWVNMAG